jgi:hypothetical protein
MREESFKLFRNCSHGLVLLDATEYRQVVPTETAALEMGLKKKPNEINFVTF